MEAVAVQELNTYKALRIAGYVLYFGWAGTYEEGIKGAWQVVGHTTPDGYATPEEALLAVS